MWTRRIWPSQTFEWTTQPDVSPFDGVTFDGFHREDGQVGTANYWLVVPMVFCENRNLKILEESFVNALGYGKASPYTTFTKSLIDAHQTGAEVTEVTFPDDRNAQLANECLRTLTGLNSCDIQAVAVRIVAIQMRCVLCWPGM